MIVVFALCTSAVLLLAWVAPLLVLLDPVDERVIRQLNERNRQNAGTQEKPDAVD